LTPELLERVQLHYVKTIQDLIDQALEREPAPLAVGRPTPEVVMTPAGAPN